MNAELHLEFTTNGAATCFRCKRQDPPWKVIRGFPLARGENLVHLNNVSGGIFGGDLLKLKAVLHAGAQATITTTGATRLYRPRPAASDAMLEASFQLEENAQLEYLPDPLIPYRQARLLQQTSFSLAHGATLFAWETIAPGRTASGEVFEYERIRLRSEVTVAGRSILKDRLLLEPLRWPPDSAARFGEYRYLVTFLAVHTGSSAAELQALEESLAAVAENATLKVGKDAGFWGASTLPAHGVVVRGMTRTSTQIPDVLYQLWSMAKQQLCQQTAVAPRKIY